MTRVNNDDGLMWSDFTASKEYADALATVPANERGAYRNKLEVSFMRLAFLDGKAGVTPEDVQRAAGLEGADAFLGAGDLTALGIAPEAQGALLKALNRTIGADAKRAGVTIARDAAETTPGQANQGLGAPVSLGRTSDVATTMGKTSPADVRAYYDRFIASTGQSFEDFNHARMSALTDVTRSRGNLPGFKTSDPEHISRLSGLGYTLVNSETKAGAPTSAVVTPPSVEHVRGGNDFFASGDYNLSDKAKQTLRDEVTRLRGQGASLSHVAIEASTDKVNVSPQLRTRLNAYLAQSGLAAIPNDTNDPTGNQRLGLARSNAVRQFLVSEQGFAPGAFTQPVIKPDQSTTGSKDDPASRYIDVAFDATKPGSTKPGSTTPGDTTYTLVRPPKATPLPKLTDHVAFALDVSGSINDQEKVSALQQQLQALERGRFSQVSYNLITFNERGMSESSTYQGTPAEVVAKMAQKIGIRQSVDEIRSFVNTRGPTQGDDTPGEPFEAVSTALNTWREQTRAAGFNPTVIVATDVDPKRTKALRDQGFLVANPAENDRTAH